MRPNEKYHVAVIRTRECHINAVWNLEPAFHLLSRDYNAALNSRHSVQQQVLITGSSTQNLSLNSRHGVQRIISRIEAHYVHPTGSTHAKPEPQDHETDMTFEEAAIEEQIEQTKKKLKDLEQSLRNERDRKKKKRVRSSLTCGTMLLTSADRSTTRSWELKTEIPFSPT